MARGIWLWVAACALGCGDADGDLDGGRPPDDATAQDVGPPVADAGPTGIEVPGLVAPVRVETDAHGIPHLRCESDADCAAALGYLHAGARFFVMDGSRRHARGRLATLYGRTAVDGDVEIRRYLSTPDGVPLEEAVWETLSPPTREVLEAYATGVNAWLADLAAGDNGARASEEYGYRVRGTGLLQEDVLDRIPAWEALDSVAILVAVLQANGDHAVEPLFTQPMLRLPADLFADLYLPRPLADSPVLDPPPDPRALRDAPPSWLERRAAIDEVRHRLGDLGIAPWAERAFAAEGRRSGELSGAIGSNNWAVSAAASAHGEAVMANDPRGGLRNPPPPFVVALDSPHPRGGRLRRLGASVPGFPLVVIGHNEHVAYGCTVSFADTTDYYVETLTDGGRAVRFEGRDVPIVEREQTFEVAAGEPVTERLRFVPHHGPIVWEDRAAARAVSVRWNGQRPAGDVEALLDLERARDLDEAVAAVRRAGALGCNVMMAASDGRVGWVVAAAIPSRPWASPEVAPWLPLPGDGSAEWGAALGPEERPALVDPPAGFVATANNAFSGAWRDGDPTNDGHPYWESNTISDLRHGRIVERLATGDRTAQSSVALQADVRALAAVAIVPGVLDEVDAHPGALDAAGEALVAALREWSHDCPSGLAGPDADGPASTDAAMIRDAAGCLAFHELVTTLGEAMLLDDLTRYGLAAGYHAYLAERVLYLAFGRPGALRSGDRLFDDAATEAIETRWDTLRASLQAAGARLIARFGADRSAWLWGRAHTVTLPSTLPVERWQIGPFANDGAMTSVDPAGGAFRSGGSFPQTHGAFMRVVVSLAPDRTTTYFQLAGGNELHRDSPFYDNFVERYLRNEPIEIGVDAQGGRTTGWLVP